MSNATPELQFWFEFASTYSYPAAMRVEDAARAAGVTLVWRPFLLGPIFVAQGWNDSPFNVYPVKGAYMWRDLARVCAKHGLPLRRPARFPRNSLLAARVALVAAGEGWCGDFTRAVYHANFAEDREIGDQAVIADLLAGLGRRPDEVIARALAPDNKERLKHQNEDAVARGIFGAPSFVTRDELFWGNDRLEDALAWAREPQSVASV
ncbi:MAG: 2-hydroxychromene-2-carboxylate isomerase [Thermodesulfobacteriota bacterium]